MFNIWKQFFNNIGIVSLILCSVFTLCLIIIGGIAFINDPRLQQTFLTPILICAGLALIILAIQSIVRSIIILIKG